LARIAVIVPVLNRPQNAQPLIDSLMASTDQAAPVFVISAHDSARQRRACLDTVADIVTAPWEPGPGDYARKIQAGYEWAEEELVLLAADDLRFQPGWLEAVEKIADEYDVGVIGTNDNANPTVKAGRHSTHPVVRRCYIDRYGGVVGEPGVVYHQGYDHQYVDNELVATAMARGCYAHAHDAIVEHRHPLYDRTVRRDATYEKGQARGLEDRRLFESRKHLWLNEVRV
jgi:glycosyltransferase involved in cell wall biosynthesis